MVLFFLLFIFWLGFKVGYIQAHYVIRHECKILGKFYIGSEVFECTSHETKGESNDPTN